MGGRGGAGDLHYCFLAAEDSHQAIALGANHSGDSDSTAPIAGQLYGMWAGEAAIGANWLDELEAVDGIFDLADRPPRRV